MDFPDKFKTFPALSATLSVMCLTDSDSKLPLFGRALRSEVKLDPVDMLGKKYKVTHTHTKTF